AETDLLKTPSSNTQGAAPQTEATIRVARIVFEGAEGVPVASLEAVVAPWLNRDVTMADLRRMTVAVEQLYAQQGFLAVRALIPQQSMKQGVLVVRVVEGRYAPPKVKAEDPRVQSSLQNYVEQATCQAPCTDAPYVMS
ncbi:POTRA domain-containing protein, partial [Mesorhizobium japonicum]|uniref:POTRA domain-containing protein n=1 Tax=Mesorhizobium japonicum TaxID=2066070 RepID=UPI003B599C95